MKVCLNPINRQKAHIRPKPVTQFAILTICQEWRYILALDNSSVISASGLDKVTESLHLRGCPILGALHKNNSLGNYSLQSGFEPAASNYPGVFASRRAQYLGNCRHEDGGAVIFYAATSPPRPRNTPGRRSGRSSASSPGPNATAAAPCSQTAAADARNGSIP
jgi:hypothetical protein